MFLLLFSVVRAEVVEIKSAGDLKKYSTDIPLIVMASLGCDMGNSFVERVEMELEDLQGVRLGVVDINKIYSDNIIKTNKSIDLGDLILVKDGKVLDVSSEGKEPHPYQGNMQYSWVYKTLKKRNLNFTMPPPEPDFLEPEPLGNSSDLKNGLAGVFPLTKNLENSLKTEASFHKGTKNKIINEAFYMTGEYGYTKNGEYVGDMFNEGKVVLGKKPESGVTVFLNIKPEKRNDDGLEKLFTVGYRVLDFYRDKKSGNLFVRAGLQCGGCRNGKDENRTAEYFFSEKVELDKWHSFVVSIDYKKARASILMNGKRLKDINLGKKLAAIYFKEDKYDEEWNFSHQAMDLGESGEGFVLKGYVRDMVAYDRTLNGKELFDLYQKYTLNKKDQPVVIDIPLPPPIDQAKFNKALRKAAKTGEPSDIEAALKSGAEINSKYKGWTALMFAANRGSEKNVKSLIQHNADPLVEVNGWNAQRLAEKKGYSSIVKLLEDHSNKKEFFSSRKITRGQKLIQGKRSPAPSDPDD